MKRPDAAPFEPLDAVLVVADVVAEAAGELEAAATAEDETSGVVLGLTSATGEDTAPGAGVVVVVSVEAVVV
jgi:hypothetical protein